MLAQQAKHFFHVRQRVLNFSINKTQEMQRHVKLQHVSVHQHQIAQRHSVLHHAVRREQHQQRNADRDNQALPGIQRR